MSVWKSNGSVPSETAGVTQPVRAYLSLGTNLGDRLANLAQAVRALADARDIEIVDVSRVYETEPLGPAGAVVADQPAYLNGAVLIETRLSAQALREQTSRIEHAMGRGEHGRWESRVIDIDLVLFGDQRIATAALTVPHASMFERAFVMRPLVDLDPDLSVDGVGKLADLLPGLSGQGCALYATVEALRGGTLSHPIERTAPMMSVSTPAAVTTGPAPGPRTTSGNVA